MNKPLFLGPLRLAALSLLLGSALALSACGGGGGSGSGSGTPEPAAGAPAPGVTPPAPAPDAASPAPTTGGGAASAGTATAVGSATGSASSATIGAAGGSLSAPDGRLALTIPAGALAADTVISIQPYTNLAHGRRGSAYRLTPEGQTFLKPVTLTFGYTDQDLQGTAVAALGAAFQTATGHWQWAGNPTVDTAARTVSIASTHFSVWSKVAGIQLLPASKTIRVKTSVALQVVGCYPLERDGLVYLGYQCDTDGETALLVLAPDWSVNGRLGGGAFGTVSGSGLSANYTAPQFEPKPNIVAVSARVDWGVKGAMLLVSNITVVGDDSWTGTASYKDPVNSASAQITWILLSRDNNIGMYKATGVATIASDNGTCSFPETSGSYESFGGGILFVDFNNTPPTYHGGSLAGGWPVTVTCKTSPGTTTHVTAAALPVFGGTGGTESVEAVGSVTVPLNPDAPMTIEGSGTDGTDGVYKWKFSRNP